MHDELLRRLNETKTMSIVGMCKNAGKTTMLNWMLSGGHLHGTLGLTSIGRDGESTDIVTGTEKPGIFVKEGTLIATAKDMLRLGDVTKEILMTTGIPTPLGEVVILRARSAGHVQLAGPSITTQLKSVSQAFFELGADRSIIDGALGRKSLGARSVAEGVILCTGAKQPKLLPGENELLGRGVSYCGTCDGMLYRGRRVAVIAQGPEAVSEANFLAGLCREVVYFGKPEDALDPRIIVSGQKPEAILGEASVSGLRAGGEDLPFDGVFIFREAAALSALLPGLKMDGAFIRVDRRMQTNLPGVFAAGDCTGLPLQVAKAVGEGCVAAISAATA